MATIGGTTGNDFIHVAGDGLVVPPGYTVIATATDDADTIESGGGGSDEVHAGGGDDVIEFGGDLTGDDRIDGGTGHDTLLITDQVDAAFASDSLSGVETIKLGAFPVLPGFQGLDSLTLDDANFSGRLAVNAESLSRHDSLFFDGSAETDSRIVFFDGAGDDHLIGGAQRDTFQMDGGGTDRVEGGGGDDIFRFGGTAASSFTAEDQVIGGDGNDVLFLSGVAVPLAFSATTVQEIETISLYFDEAITLTTDDGNVAAGQTMTIDATHLAYGAALTFDGSAETDGHLEVVGSRGNDIVTAGAGDDHFDLGPGIDIAKGGAGDDTIELHPDGFAGSLSFGGTGHDVLVLDGAFSAGFTFAADAMSDIEELDIANAIGPYRIATDDANVAAGQTLVVNANTGLLPITLVFDGSAETDGHFAITGRRADDRLTGGALNDTIDGREGADTMIGGGGNDTYEVDDANDVIIETAAGDTDLVESAVSYALGANVENLTLTDRAFEGTGNGLANRITGTAGPNHLNGAGGDDVLRGDDGGDVLSGGAGDDVLDGGAAADAMAGGDGNDTYIVDTAGDRVVETSPSVGSDLVESAASFTLGANIEDLTLLGAGSVDGAGNGLANRLTGNGGSNRLAGDAGTDTLNGFGGNDVLNGGSGADRMRGGKGNDTYLVDNRHDTVAEAGGSSGGTDLVKSSVSFTLGAHVESLRLTGRANIHGAGNGLGNHISGNGGANHLSGGAEADTLNGFGGNDVLNGGRGADHLHGGSGNDVYLVDNRHDAVVETAGRSGGTDLVKSSVGFTLGAHIENLKLTGRGHVHGAGNGLANHISGNASANHLSGGGGSDRLSGGAGRDVLDGGAGHDTLSGGSGNDTFAFDTALTRANTDTIAGFAPGHDRIRLDHSIFTALGRGHLAAAAFSGDGHVHTAAQHVLYNPNNGSLIYDSNGSAAGGAHHFVTLHPHLALSAADFLVVA